MSSLHRASTDALILVFHIMHVNAYLCPLHIRVPVDALCRDDTGPISCGLHTKRLQFWQ